jgi:lysyl-tRNA synthetase class 2
VASPFLRSFCEPVVGAYPRGRGRSPARIRAASLCLMKPVTRARSLGVAVIAAGMVNVVSALTPAWHARLADLRTFMTQVGEGVASGATALLGLALVLLGRGVAQRRRTAYTVAIVLLSLSTVAHVFKGLDVEESSYTFVLAVLLWWQRRLFIVGHEPARWHHVARIVPAVLGMDVAYGALGLLLRRGLVHPSLTPLNLVQEIGARMIGMTGPLHIEHAFGHWFPASLTWLGAASMALAFILVLAPVAENEVAVRGERELVRGLIVRPDGDTLDYFSLRRDKRYVFSDGRNAAIAYRVVHGVALATGDPVGEPSAFPGVLSNFLSVCERKGWRPAVLGVRATRCEMYEAAGLKTVYIGDEALIDVPEFSLVGRHMRNARQSANHTRALGCTTQIFRERDLDPTLRRALIGISDRWREGAREFGFLMALGDLLDGRNPECVVIVLRDAEGTPIAFQRYVPCRAGRALSLDAMRRDKEGPGGVNERMIVDLVEWARAEGIEEISLNFAAFREWISEGADLKFGQILPAFVLRRVSPYLQFEALHKFNGKFHPRWVPRFAAFRTLADLPPIGIAALSAEQILPFDGRSEASVPSARN